MGQRCEEDRGFQEGPETLLPPTMLKRYRIRPLRQQIVFRISDRFEPFVRATLARCLEGHVRKPAVLCRAMPMFDARGDEHNVARM